MRILLARIGGCLLIPLLAGAGACSQEVRPFNHPNMGIYDRNVSRIDVVPLIIQDEERAAQVASKYIDIESLVLERERTRLLAMKDISDLSSRYVLPQEKLRLSIAKFPADGDEALRRYIQLQMEIRKLTTQEEFAQLDKVR